MRIALGMLHQDEEAAVDHFAALAAHPDDQVLACREAHSFLRYCGATHFARLEDVLARMIASQQPAVRARGASQAAIARLANPDAQALVDRCRAGDAALRKGLATVFAVNASREQHRGLALPP